jgi:hypothetical protein
MLETVFQTRREREAWKGWKWFIVVVGVAWLAVRAGDWDISFCAISIVR